MDQVEFTEMLTGRQYLITVKRFDPRLYTAAHGWTGGLSLPPRSLHELYQPVHVQQPGSQTSSHRRGRRAPSAQAHVRPKARRGGDAPGVDKELAAFGRAVVDTYGDDPDADQWESLLADVEALA